MEVQTKSNEELFQKLNDFSLDNPNSEFKFSDRLSRENGWTKTFSKRVVEEYKKFVYLSAITGKSLTPSEEVDQAWHLHMIYTQSYWKEMCGKILGGLKLHHGPTKGGHAEKERYDNQYEYTLQVYKEEFGYDAPSDIWPDAKERFGNVNFRRVSVRDNIILNKAKVRVYLASFTVAINMVFLWFLLSSTKTKSTEADAWTIILWILGIAFVIFIIRGLWRYANRNDRNDKNNNSGSSSGGCSSGGCTITSAFFGCGSSGCGSSGSSGCGSSGCGSSGCGGGGCGGCGGCGS